MTGYSSPIGIGLPGFGQAGEAHAWLDGTAPRISLARARSAAVWFLFFPDTTVFPLKWFSDAAAQDTPPSSVG